MTWHADRIRANATCVSLLRGIKRTLIHTCSSGTPTSFYIRIEVEFIVQNAVRLEMVSILGWMYLLRSHGLFLLAKQKENRVIGCGKKGKSVLLQERVANKHNKREEDYKQTKSKVGGERICTCTTQAKVCGFLRLYHGGMDLLRLRLHHLQVEPGAGTYNFPSYWYHRDVVAVAYLDHESIRVVEEQLLHVDPAFFYSLPHRINPHFPQLLLHHHHVLALHPFIHIKL